MGYRNIIFRAATLAMDGTLKFFGDKNRTRFKALLSEQITPVVEVRTKRGKIRFSCPGRAPLTRTETFHTKEPETIEWINTFDENAVFWDIGANVGIYTLYAALGEGVRVVSFEPASMNYFLLNRNIEINGMKNVLPLCIALGRTSEFGYLNMSTTQVGKAGCSFGEPINDIGDKFEAVFRQGSICHAVDDMISTFKMPFPNFMKIDVDGNENLIIEGAKNTLRDKRLKSILIELRKDRRDYDEVMRRIESFGMRISTIGRNVNHIFSRK